MAVQKPGKDVGVLPSVRFGGALAGSTVVLQRFDGESLTLWRYDCRVMVLDEDPLRLVLQVLPTCIAIAGCLVMVVVAICTGVEWGLENGGYRRRLPRNAASGANTFFVESTGYIKHGVSILVGVVDEVDDSRLGLVDGECARFLVVVIAEWYGTVYNWYSTMAV